MVFTSSSLKRAALTHRRSFEAQEDQSDPADTKGSPDVLQLKKSTGRWCERT